MGEGLLAPLSIKVLVPSEGSAFKGIPTLHLNPTTLQSKL